MQISDPELAVLQPFGGFTKSVGMQQVLAAMLWLVHPTKFTSMQTSDLELAALQPLQVSPSSPAHGPLEQVLATLLLLVHPTRFTSLQTSDPELACLATVCGSHQVHWHADV